MKNKNGNTENEDFIKWIQIEAGSGDEKLEDKVMEEILQQRLKTIAKPVTSFLSIKTIIVVYCILSVVLLTWCFLDGSITAYLNMFDFKEEFTEVNQNIGYHLMIIATGALSIVFFLVHRIQAKHYS